jgi:hypothetical protein
MFGPVEFLSGLEFKLVLHPDTGQFGFFRFLEFIVASERKAFSCRKIRTFSEFSKAPSGNNLRQPTATHSEALLRHWCLLLPGRDRLLI